MTDKPEFIDMISEATRQSRRRLLAAPRIDVQPPIKKKSRMGHWPPERWTEWRTETLTPWKLKPWRSE